MEKIKVNGITLAYTRRGQGTPLVLVHGYPLDHTNIALAFARAWPGRLRGLGLVASQALADTPERRQGRYDTAAMVMKDGVGQVAETMSAALTPVARVQAFVRGVIAAQPPAGVAGALKAMAGREESTPILPSFQFPVVVVHGDADALIPVERAREVKAALAQPWLVELSGVGHMPMMEAAQATAEALKRLA